mgnify:CR=1 FL=1
MQSHNAATSYDVTTMSQLRGEISGEGPQRYEIIATRGEILSGAGPQLRGEIAVQNLNAATKSHLRGEIVKRCRATTRLQSQSDN